MAHLELRILFANNIQAAFALYYFTIRTTLLDGCLYFHFCIFLLFVSEGNPTFRQIVRGHFNFNLITRKDADVVHAHLA